MNCKTCGTTNEALDKVLGDVRELIRWAEADAEHSSENDAPETAEDDRNRARTLRAALRLLEGCRR